MVPIYEMLHFQNWAKTVAVVVHGFKPTCVQDVKSIVQYAKGYNDRAKKTGKPKLKVRFPFSVILYSTKQSISCSFTVTVNCPIDIQCM